MSTRFFYLHHTRSITLAQSHSGIQAYTCTVKLLRHGARARCLSSEAQEQKAQNDTQSIAIPKVVSH